MARSLTSKCWGTNEGFGTSDASDRGFSSNQALEDDLTEGALGSRVWRRFDLEHENVIFNLIQPKRFTLFDDADPEFLDFRPAPPNAFVPESAEFPDSTDRPAIG